MQPAAGSCMRQLHAIMQALQKPKGQRSLGPEPGVALVEVGRERECAVDHDREQRVHGADVVQHVLILCVWGGGWGEGARHAFVIH